MISNYFFLNGKGCLFYAYEIELSEKPFFHLRRMKTGTSTSIKSKAMADRPMDKSIKEKMLIGKRIIKHLS